ncbi:hypothetical protein ACIBHX_02090 [Nonomuraea sp. NPDC050536]|uniref:hypothetical protein n=1 Tax=Nonomuraea sp. NPDC050536 TaxID=3364366 RepID=UPI0037C8AA92
MPASVRAVSTATPSTGSSSANKPSGTLQGDILLAFHSVDDGALTDMGTPTGGATWLSLATRQAGTGYDNKTKVWWKVAGASEPSTYTFTQNSSGDGCIAIACVMDADTAVTPVVAQTGNDTASTTVPTPGITPTRSDDLELRWASGNPDATATSWTSPAGYTEVADVTGGNQTGSLAYKQLTSNAATGSLNFTATISLQFRQGFTVAVASILVPVVHRPVYGTTAVHRAANW